MREKITLLTLARKKNSKEINILNLTRKTLDMLYKEAEVKENEMRILIHLNTKNQEIAERFAKLFEEYFTDINVIRTGY